MESATGYVVMSNGYVVTRDGLDSLPVVRRRLPRGDAPGVWWCPVCDRSLQDSVKVCACGGRLTDAPPDLKAAALARVAAAERAYRDALHYAGSIGALPVEDTAAPPTFTASSEAFTEAVTVPVMVVTEPPHYTKPKAKGKRR